MDYFDGGCHNTVSKHVPMETCRPTSGASSLPCRYPAYRNDKTRMLSYDGASKDLMKMARALSEAGYFYEGYNSKTCCYACGMKHENWSEKDDPLKEHLDKNPNCIHAVQTKSKFDNESSTDLENQFNPEIAKTAKYPEYAEPMLRRTTFQEANGPDYLKFRTKELLDSGFFYSGSGNKVTCFHCGINTSLDLSENPTDKHLSVSPNCEFLRYEIKRLNENTEKTRHQLLCKVCLGKQVDTTFRPCGHLATCESCARQLDACPICRATIIEKVKTFF
uniref:Baculoviral IAP repeat-containing protein 2-like isoform X1 n=1 Tax=Crassostrea virginica TaxID=6565 RepID=A0A8B8ANF6_CRAVI|nr:baculoviral IAP repeat-containing protein 2-like isoform X1 [Crassostrea virginica]